MSELGEDFDDDDDDKKGITDYLGLTFREWLDFRGRFGDIAYYFEYEVIGYEPNDTKTVYDLSSITERVKEKVQLSLKTGVDHLIEIAKDYPLPPFNPDVFY